MVAIVPLALMLFLKALRLGLFLVLTFSTSGCYVMKQGYYQGNLLRTREPIDVLIWQKNTDESLRQKLKTVKEILSYAKKHGMNVGQAYSSYVKSSEGAVSFLVFAAHPDRLEQKTWTFPIVGRVPYLGYFHRADRDEMAKELISEGLDVSLSTAAAFSSLGWFDDPIYSTMLDDDMDELAHLLFHELTHRSFWLPGASEFNENLAEYVATKLTLSFLTEKEEVSLLKHYNEDREDLVLYRNWISSVKKDLASFYGKNKGSDKDFAAKKAAVFAEALARMPRFKTDSYAKLSKAKWNNASILASSIYLPDMAKFEKMFLCSKANNFKEFFEFLKENAAKDKSRVKNLDLCAA